MFVRIGGAGGGSLGGWLVVDDGSAAGMYCVQYNCSATPPSRFLSLSLEAKS